MRSEPGVGHNTGMGRPVLKRTVLLCVLGLAGCASESRDAQPPQSELPRDPRPAQPADAAVWTPQKAEFLEMAERLDNSANEAFGTGEVEKLREQLQVAGQSPQQQILLNNKLCSHLLRLGDTSAAIEQIEKSVALAESLPELVPALWRDIHRRRAIAYMRAAEETNCIRRHDANCGILPFRDGGVHADPEPARQARDSMLAALEHQGDDLLGRWLLNLTVMALGEYPDGVPARYRIPPETFRSDHDIGRFTNVAAALGLDTLNLAGGAIVDDFDGDALLDIVTSTMDPRGPLTYFRNLGNGRFEDLSSRSRLDDQLGGLNCVGADYDNDGDRDILVLRGAWMFDDGRMRNSLVQNNGDGTFSDVTREAGLAEPPQPTQAGVWGDFDNDGDLDLYIGNESRVELSRGEGNYPSQLFSNNGDGTFTDIAPRAGVTNDRLAKGVTAGDFDNDGDLDLYVSNIGPNRLYRNDGGGTFTDVAEKLGVSEPGRRSFVPWFFDYDNDGHLDLFVGAYDSKTVDTVSDMLGLDHEATTPRLYRNDGDGGFVNVTEQVGLDHAYAPMGANFGDLDNDGYLDIYLATGNPGFESLEPNVMLRNDRGRSFQNVTTSGGFGHIQKGHGVSFADIDNDGDQDIFHQVGGMFPGDRYRNALFLNPGHGHHYLTVVLEGTTTNRGGIGARIRVVVDTPDGQAEFHRAVGSVGSFGSSPLRQEIGLGDAVGIERVEIRWPASGTAQVLTGVPMDTAIRVTEQQPGYETLVTEAIELETGMSR